MNQTMDAQYHDMKNLAAQSQATVQASVQASMEAMFKQYSGLSLTGGSTNTAETGCWC